MVHNAAQPRSQSFPMDVARFFKSLSNLSMEAKYRAQDDYISHLLNHITVERSRMQVKSEGCAQMSQAKKPKAEEFDGLSELAKLYSIIASLLDELEKTVEKRWEIASTKSFNARMSAIEDLQADFDVVVGTKQQGIQNVAEKAKPSRLPAESSVGDADAVYKENLARDHRFYGGYVPKEGE